MHSCEFDDGIMENKNLQPSGRFIVAEKNYEDLMHDQKIAGITKKLSTKTNLNVDNTNGRMVYSQTNNFSIDTDKSVYIEDTRNGIYSYTFVVNRTGVTNTDIVENLVLSFPQAGYIQLKLVKYSLTPAEKEDVSKGVYIDLTDNVVTTTSITDTEFVSQISDKIIFVAIANCISIYETSCTGSENHQDGYLSNGQECPGHHQEFLGQICVADNGGGVSWPDLPVNSGTPGQNGPGQNGGSPNPNGQIVTTPVLPELDSPCDKIKPLLSLSKANLKPKIEALQSCAGQSAGECGTSLQKNAAGAYSSNPVPPNPTGSELVVPHGGNVYGSIHTHPIFPNTIPMYSWGDVHSLFKTYDNSAPHNDKDVTVILVVKTFDALGNPVDTTYALIIKNTSAFTTKMDAELAALNGTLKEKIEEKNKELKSRYENVGRGIKNWEKGFLSFFKDYNISLMKANDALTNWNELTVNNDSLPYDQQIIISNPCIL